MEIAMDVLIGTPKSGRGFQVWRICNRNRYCDIFLINDGVVGVGVVNSDDFHWLNLGSHEDRAKRISKIAMGLLKEIVEITS